MLKKTFSLVFFAAAVAIVAQLPGNDPISTVCILGATTASLVTSVAFLTAA